MPQMAEFLNCAALNSVSLHAAKVKMSKNRRLNVYQKYNPVALTKYMMLDGRFNVQPITDPQQPTDTTLSNNDHLKLAQFSLL